MLPFLYVLGIAQDGGHPHAGCARSCCADPTQVHLPSSLAIVDPETSQRWLLDATPALPEQLRRLDAVAPRGKLLLDGILLTHAHLGHYTGLMYLGREVMGTKGIPVHTQARMADYLTKNGPWSQLVSLGNVALSVGTEVRLNDRLRATALPVPHRDEYSETVAWRIHGPTRSALYLPDIDRWDAWSSQLEDVLATVDVAYLDGTFWADGELERDMREVPHPRIRETMTRLASLPSSARAKVRFIHLNHTNPALRTGSPEAIEVERGGFRMAVEGERVGL